VHWARLEASALGSLIAACPAWKEEEKERKLVRRNLRAMKVVEACLGSSVGYSTGLQCTLVVWSSLAQTMHMLPAKVAVAAHHLHVVTLPTLPSHYCRACTMGHHWIGLSTSHANGKSRHSGLDSMVWVGTNLIHDFTAVTCSVKLAFFCEIRLFPWNSVIFREF